MIKRGANIVARRLVVGMDKPVADPTMLGYTGSMSAPRTRIRVGDVEDGPAVSALLAGLFHHPAGRDTAQTLEIERAVVEPERTLVVEDAGTIVGFAAAYTRELTVPGATVPAAHVTLVGVAPTHRRQGLLTAMMHRQLRELAAAGDEPIAVLWASETAIYPRFGYGPAAQRLRMEIMSREVRPPAPASADSPGRLRTVSPTDAVADLAAVYERLRGQRTGWSSRDGDWWRLVLADVDGADGATDLRGVVYETPDGPTGYALWRTVDRWDRHGPDAVVRVREVVAADPAAYAELWRFLLTLDLTRTVTVQFAAVDEPLQYLVGEPRRLGSSLADALWVRIVDLPAALAARTYPTAVDVVLEVTDPLLPANTGRWRLSADPYGPARCVATDDPADLTCPVRDLGAAYLGATSLAVLAAAGSVRELTPGALRAAATAFGWHRLPAPTETF